MDTYSLYRDPQTGHQSLHAAAPLKKGQVLCSFSAADVLDHPTRFTVQVAEGRHLLLSPEPLWFTNHSCNPNVFFDTGSMELVCLEDVETGNELCFFYPSTEWAMAEPFDCLCGAPNCLGRIKGASVLPDEVLTGYKLTPYVHKKWGERKGEKS
jgi:hypothetical protein